MKTLLLILTACLLTPAIGLANEDCFFTPLLDRDLTGPGTYTITMEVETPTLSEGDAVVVAAFNWGATPETAAPIAASLRFVSPEDLISGLLPLSYCQQVVLFRFYIFHLIFLSYLIETQYLYVRSLQGQ